MKFVPEEIDLHFNTMKNVSCFYLLYLSYIAIIRKAHRVPSICPARAVYPTTLLIFVLFLQVLIAIDDDDHNITKQHKLIGKGVKPFACY